MRTKCFLWSARNTGSDGGASGTTAHGVCSSYARALNALAGWCRSQWEEQDHETPLPEDDAGVVREYFDFWTPEEEFDIEELNLDEGVET
jgi:hypothetical protein